MEFVKKTRRYFYFKDFSAGDRAELQDQRGVTPEDGLLKFPRCYPEERNPVNKENENKLTFSNIKDCQAWYEETIMKFTPNKKHDKRLYGVKSEASDLADAEFEKIVPFLNAPGNISVDDLRVYKSYLAHNFVDRDKERFPIDVLKSLSDTIVGKSKLFGHDWNATGEGRYYSSELVKKTVDEVVAMVGPHPNKGFKKQLKEIEKIDGGLYWMVPKFYMLKDDERMIRKIDAGITSDESIGFKAPSMEPVKDGDGNLKWREYRNLDNETAEAFEGSFVFLGSQYGARTRPKSAGGQEEFETTDEIEIDDITDENIKTICANIDLTVEHVKAWSPAYVDNLEDGCFAYVEKGTKDNEGKTIPRTARHLPHHSKGGVTVDLAHLRYALSKVDQVEPVTKVASDVLRGKAKAHLMLEAKKLKMGDYNEGGKMKFKLTSIDYETELELDEEGVGKLNTELEENIAGVIKDQADTLDEKDVEIQTFKDALGEIKLEDIPAMQTNAEFGVKYFVHLVDETNKYKMLNGFVVNDPESIKADKELLSKLSFGQIETLLKEFRTKWETDHPANGDLPENTEMPEKKETELYVPVGN